MFNFPKDIPYRTQAEVLSDGCRLANAVVEKIEIGFVGHVSQTVVCLTVNTGIRRYVLFADWALTRDLGFVIAVLFDTFGIIDDDYRDIQYLREKPLRLVIKKDRLVGIGNFLKDEKFLYLDDLMQELREKNDVGRSQ
jgi:hypothetical protein